MATLAYLTTQTLLACAFFEPETPDALLDVGARDEHSQLGDGFMANLLILGAHPNQGSLPF